MKLVKSVNYRSIIRVVSQFFIGEWVVVWGHIISFEFLALLLPVENNKVFWRVAGK